MELRGYCWNSTPEAINKIVCTISIHLEKQLALFTQGLSIFSREKNPPDLIL